MDWWTILTILILVILVSSLVLAVPQKSVKRDAPILLDRTRIKEINKAIQKPEFLEDLRLLLDAAEIEFLLSIPLSSPDDERRIKYLLKRLGPKRIASLLSMHRDQS